jgi:DNA polymerase III alpha subunit
MLTNSDANSETSIITGILTHGIDILEHCVVSTDTLDQYAGQCSAEYLNYPLPNISIDSNNWFIPQEYKDMDIANWLISQCTTDNQQMRVCNELILFIDHDMLPVLLAMKYVVDVLRQHDIVWGVGRGSSVASYILYLIGVHKIDSIKYNIPITEFFK